MLSNRPPARGEFQGTKIRLVSRYPRPPSALLKLPNEILLLILDNLTTCSVTCFGLTCKRIYKLYKDKLHGPISLDELDFVTSAHPSLGLQSAGHTCLGMLLARWRGIGPRFRLWYPQRSAYRAQLKHEPPQVWHFLPKATYGERVIRGNDSISEDTDLWDRYMDYARMQQNGISYLPNPRNKTLIQWEREAIDAVVRDSERHENNRAWIGFWMMTRIWHEKVNVIHLLVTGKKEIIKKRRR
jgi:F-box-like